MASEGSSEDRLTDTFFDPFFNWEWGAGPERRASPFPERVCNPRYLPLADIRGAAAEGPNGWKTAIGCRPMSGQLNPQR